MPSPKRLTAERVQKKITDQTTLLPSFYVCPYADPTSTESTNYSLVNYPDASIACDINLAFINPSDDQVKNNLGNTISDNYLCHLRDKVAIKQFIARMQELKRRIFVSYIDAPTVHWDAVNVENFVRNTEGEIAADGTVFTNELMETYQPVGRMWDAETPAGLAMATVMKACFLRGIQRDPDNYVFIYTTYANRDIDQQILAMVLDPTTSPVDAELYALGFRQISDFITMRGDLSFLETMSYSDPAADRFQEADTYAIQYLAKGDATKLNEMRKFISIGVAPGLTSDDDATTIAAACNPTQVDGYGRFMVWAGNCPAGVSLFSEMIAAQKQPLPAHRVDKELDSIQLINNPEKARISGNRDRFFAPVLSQGGLKTTDVKEKSLLQQAWSLVGYA